MHRGVTAGVTNEFPSLHPGLQTIGELPVGEAVQLLDKVDKRAANNVRIVVEADETDLTSRNKASDILAFWKWGKKKTTEPVYLASSHVFGYLPPSAGRTKAIVDAAEVDPQKSLKRKQLKITLDRLRAANYPGGGTHNILVEFYARHQIKGEQQPVHFTQTFRVRQAQGAGISGYPIFLGLAAGAEGVDFKVLTVNVSNVEDQRALEFLRSDPFTSGLKLLNTLNPALPAVTGFARGVIELVLKRHENIPVQSFELGLDLSKISTRAHLAEGSYFAVQVPDHDHWEWSHWKWTQSGGIVHRKRSTKMPYNYLVFSVSEYHQ